MSKPTSDFALLLRELPLTTRAKVHLYLLFIASRASGGEWFAMVKSRTIGEALDIDSNKEVVAALQEIGVREGTSKFKNRTVPGFFLAARSSPSCQGQQEEHEQGDERDGGATGTQERQELQDQKEQQEEGPKSEPSLGPNCDPTQDLGYR